MIIYPTWHDSYPEPIEKRSKKNNPISSDKINKKISSIKLTKTQLLDGLDDFINKLNQNPKLKKQVFKSILDSAPLAQVKKTNPSLFSPEFVTTYTAGSLVTKQLYVNNLMVADGKIAHPILEAVHYAQKTLDDLSSLTYSATIQYTTLTSNLDSYTWPSDDLINSMKKKDFLYSLGIPFDHCYDVEYLNIDIGLVTSVITVQKALPF